MRTSDVRTPQRFTVLHHIYSTIFPLILGVKVLHLQLCKIVITTEVCIHLMYAHLAHAFI